MSSGELCSESLPSLRVTWSIPDFFKLPAESEISIQSPDFTFADGRYSLRLRLFKDSIFEAIGIELLNSIGNDPGGAVMYGVQLKCRSAEEYDIYRYSDDKIFIYYRGDLEDSRDRFVPDGTLTFLCSVRLRRASSGGSPKSGGAQTRVIPKSRMSSGDLSSVSTPFLYVTWTIPEFFQMSRESEYTLDSPEFPFSGRRYCLRLRSYENWRVRIHLVNLTDGVPGRYVWNEVGLKLTSGEEIPLYRRGTSTTPEFYILRITLDSNESEWFPDGHLTVFCSVRSREPSSTGSPMSGGAWVARFISQRKGRFLLALIGFVFIAVPTFFTSY